MVPARCMSLNLAVRYADVISSVVLQIPWILIPRHAGQALAPPEDQAILLPTEDYTIHMSQDDHHHGSRQ
ncbi:hypothetical protein ZWY2020_011439 [Hordeum vulgare]|nr:hypothetical protein ZWY2020_011439 [Hordeum vulgare]